MPGLLLRLLPVLLAGVWLAACAPRSSDEDQLRALIAASEKAAKARDVNGMLAGVADDYADSMGFDKARLQNYLRGYFFTRSKAELLVTLGEFEFPSEDLARVDATATQVSLRDPDRVRLQLEFRRRDGKWLVTRIERLDR